MAARRRKITIETTGRTDLDNLFEKSDVLDGASSHHPFIAFLTEGDTVKVQLFDRATKLRDLPPDTPVMVQWPGKWRSDFFQLTVGDVLTPLAQAEEEERRRERISRRRRYDPDYSPAGEARKNFLFNAGTMRKHGRLEESEVYARLAEALADADPEEDARVLLSAAGLKSPY